MSLFDQANLAEITHPDYPGERLVACRNPTLATERARKRLALLEATDTELTKITAAVVTGRLTGAGKIGVRVGKVIGRYTMAKHYTLDITEDTFAFTRNTEAINAEAALDGLCVIRTTVPVEQMDPAQVVATYTSLSRVERDFRSLKAIDVDLRPIHHDTETRVRAHVFICMLAAYLVWHLRQAWAPLTFTDEHRPDPSLPSPPPGGSGRRPQGCDQDHHRRPARHQLHQPPGPPRHAHPQPPTRRQRHVRLRPARDTHPHRAPSVRTPGRPDPTDPEVAGRRSCQVVERAYDIGSASRS